MMLKRLLAKSIILFLCTATLLLLGCNSQPDGVTANAQSIRLKDYQGKWVVINYWAKWCKPCLTELPELNEFYKKHTKRVMVLGVSFDKLPRQEIQQFAKKLNLHFPLLVTFNKAVLGIDHIGALPVTYILSPQGKLIKTLHGAQTQTSLEKALALI